MDKIFINSAEDYIDLGQNFESQGELQKAEQAFLRALKLTEENVLSYGSPQNSIQAKELCLILAELNMQQGNMHGADVFYVKAMQYSQKRT